MKSPLKAIRQKCLDCAGGKPSEVRKCVSDDCPLYPYRMGHNPARKGICRKGVGGCVLSGKISTQQQILGTKLTYSTREA